MPGFPPPLALLLPPLALVRLVCIACGSVDPSLSSTCPATASLRSTECMPQTETLNPCPFLCTCAPFVLLPCPVPTAMWACRSATRALPLHRTASRLPTACQVKLKPQRPVIQRLRWQGRSAGLAAMNPPCNYNPDSLASLLYPLLLTLLQVCSPLVPRWSSFWSCCWEGTVGCLTTLTLPSSFRRGGCSGRRPEACPRVSWQADPHCFTIIPSRKPFLCCCITSARKGA